MATKIKTVNVPDSPIICAYAAHLGAYYLLALDTSSGIIHITGFNPETREAFEHSECHIKSMADHVRMMYRDAESLYGQAIYVLILEYKRVWEEIAHHAITGE